VKLRKDTVNFFLTRGNVGNKVGFGGTGDFFGGAGRSPLLTCMKQKINTYPLVRNLEKVKIR